MTKKLFIFAILLLWGIPVFAQSVDTAWVRRYNGPGDSTDYAQAIVVDDSGNVYVTGYSYGTGTDDDYTTIKYYPNGDTAWVRRYDGPANSGDQARAIALDSNKNIYVSGYSWGSGTSADYTILKYYPNGDTVWLRRYDGPLSSNDYSRSRSMAVDYSNNVYITGMSHGSGTDYDFATIKYNSDGDTIWVRRYDGPENEWDEATAIAVDDNGNVYVTGYGPGYGDSANYITIKYLPNGDSGWVKIYDGSSNSNDLAFAISVDSSGNAYVTGRSTGTTGWDYATIKYDTSGTEIWTSRYDGTSADEAQAIVTDAAGNIYVTGNSMGIGTGMDYVTIMYYNDGDTAWVRRYNGLASSYDWSTAIAVDDNGNVYVTGYSYGTGTEGDYATLKYSPNGDSVWVQKYNGPTNDEDRAYAIALDEPGSVYVTGRSYETGDDYVTIKYVQFLRGNVNSDTSRSVSDVVYLINYLFKGGPEPYPAVIVGDANCDGAVSISDVVYLINYLFKGGTEPCI